MKIFSFTLTQEVDKALREISQVRYWTRSQAVRQAIMTLHEIVRKEAQISSKDKTYEK